MITGLGLLAALTVTGLATILISTGAVMIGFAEVVLLSGVEKLSSSTATLEAKLPQNCAS